MAVLIIIYLLSIILTIFLEVLYWMKHFNYSQEKTLGELVDFLWSGWLEYKAVMPIPMPPIIVLLFPVNIICVLIGAFHLVSFSGEWRNKRIK